jgi:hypothetical protein
MCYLNWLLSVFEPEIVPVLLLKAMVALNLAVGAQPLKLIVTCPLDELFPGAISPTGRGKEAGLMIVGVQEAP